MQNTIDRGIWIRVRRGVAVGAGTVALCGALATARAAEKAPAGQALADRYVACWGHFNERRWDEFGKCFTKDAVATVAGLPQMKGGAAIVENGAKPFTVAFPDGKGELQLTLVNARYAASVALVRGTHTGPLRGPGGDIPATQKKIGLLIAHAVEFGDGTAAKREWSVRDSGTMMAQLGLNPAPARPAMTEGWKERPAVVATGSATEKKNLATARRAYALFNAHDKKFFELLADDIADRNQTLPADLNGKAAVTALASGFWQMSSNAKVEAPVMFAAGDYVVAIGSFVGTNDGDNPALGLKKTGKAFKIALFEVTRWKDGKLQEIWPFFDGMELAAQLGLLPPPPAKHAQR